MTKILMYMLTLCSGLAVSVKDQENAREKLAMQVEHMVIEDIESTYGLKFCGSGGGMMDCIRLMSLSFNCDRDLSFGEAVSLASNCTHLFLKHVNNNEAIRPHLCRYPFDTSNVQVIIFFSRSDGTDFSDSEFTCLTARNGTINFLDTRNLKKHSFPVVPFNQYSNETK